MRKIVISCIIISILFGTFSLTTVAKQETPKQDEITGSITCNNVFGTVLGNIIITCEMVYPTKEKIGELTYLRAHGGGTFENLKVPGIYKLTASTDGTWYFGAPIGGIPRLVFLNKINPNQDHVGVWLLPGIN